MKRKIILAVPLAAIFLTACNHALVPEDAAEKIISAVPPETSGDRQTEGQGDLETGSNGEIMTESGEGGFRQAVLTSPGYGYYEAAATTNAEAAFAKELTLVSETPNQIIDTEAWFQQNQLQLPVVQGIFAGIMSGSAGPESGINDNLWQMSRSCFYDEQYIYTVDQNTGARNSTGQMASLYSVLTVYDRETEKALYRLDYSDFCFRSEADRSTSQYVDTEITWAEIRDDVLYTALFYNGYAEPNTSYITAVSLDDFTVLWKSAELSCNSYNFIIEEDVLLCGYGFTAEPDYLNQLDLASGKYVGQLELKSKPDYLVKKDGRLYVRCYDTDYVFHLGAGADVGAEALGDSVGELAPEAAAAYLDAIRELISQYGEGRITSGAEGGSGMALGVGVIRLLDFNGDGQEELFCAFADGEGAGAAYINKQVIYGYAQGLHTIAAPDRVSNPGTDVSPTITFLSKDGIVYLVDIYEMATGNYLTLRDGKMVSVLSYYNDIWAGSDYQLNRNPATEQEVAAAIQEMEGGGGIESISLIRADVMRTELERARQTIADITELSH